MQNSLLNNWQEKKFGEVATLHRGYDLPIEKIINGRHPVVFSNGKIEYHNQYKIKGPGVITGRSGSLGNTFYINEDYWPHNTTLYVSDFHGNDPKFIFYLLKTLNFAFMNAGSGVPTLNRNHVHEIPLNIPTDPQIQKQIASILSSFDNKIELNNKIAETLEEMAQAVFKEWFVNFRFPDYEKVKFVDSELGKIPEGWKIKPFGNVVINFDRRRKPLSNMERASIKGKFPYYGATEIMDYIDKYIFDGEYLLIAEDGTVETKDGKAVLQFVDGKFWVNNHAHIIQGTKEAPLFYLYLALKILSIKKYITGAVQLKLTQENLNKIPIIVPQIELMEQFTSIVYPMILQNRKLNYENQKLALLRDLLLPKFMKGNIKI